MALFPENGPKTKLLELFLLIGGLKIMSIQTARNMHDMSRPKMIDMSLIWSAVGNIHNEAKPTEVSLI